MEARTTEHDCDNPDLSLPEGMTCRDCYACRFCVGIGCTTAESSRCDYYPVRFRSIARVENTDE